MPVYMSARAGLAVGKAVLLSTQIRTFLDYRSAVGSSRQDRNSHHSLRLLLTDRPCAGVSFHNCVVRKGRALFGCWVVLSKSLTVSLAGLEFPYVVQVGILLPQPGSWVLGF